MPDHDESETRYKSSWHAKALTAFAERLASLVELHNSSENLDDPLAEHIGHHGKVLFIGRALRAEFEKTVDILGSKYFNKLARDSVRSRLVRFMIEMKPEQSVESQVDAMAAEMDEATFDFTVTLPLQGIEIEGNLELDFGALELQQFNDEIFDKRVAEPLRNIIWRSKIPDDAKARSARSTAGVRGTASQCGLRNFSLRR